MNTKSVNMNESFQWHKSVSVKTLFFVIGSFCIFHVLTLAFDKAVLYGNVVFLIILLSSKKRHCGFLKKDFRSLENVFQS